MGEIRVLIGDVCSHRSHYYISNCRLPRGEYFFLRFWDFVVLPARIFEFTKTSREALLATYDRCLAHPMPSHTPLGASLKFAVS